MAGHRIGSLEQENAAVSHPAVASGSPIGDITPLEEVRRAYQELRGEL